MNIASANEVHIIKSVPPILSKSDKVAIDSEWFQMQKSKLHRPHGNHAVTTFCFNDRDVYAVTDTNDLAQSFANVNEAVHLYHNAKFDVRQFRRFIDYPRRTRLWDSMLIEQIMWSGYYSDFALNDLVRRYLDTYLPKDTRNEFQDADEMTPEMLEYSCLDTLYTRKVYQAQRNLISDTDLSIWTEIELPFMWTLLSMSGVRLDKEKWLALAEKNRRTAEEIQEKYGHWTEVQGKRSVKKVFDGINLNSPAQVKSHLQSLGYKVKTTNAEFLDSISDECNFAKDMCVYRTFFKRSSTYGEGFIEDYLEPDGKIYADIYQMGAETGRTSCRAPNLQNQPHEFDYRDCFIADEGKCMIVGDWSAQEPKFAAYFSQDKRLIDALNSDEKLYVRIGREALGINITKNDPEYKHLKSTVLGLFYGMSAQGLAKRIKITTDSKMNEMLAQGMIDKILETYPGIKEYMKNQKKAKDYATSIYGRKIWINKYSNQWERNVLNAPIQSSAAEAMKIASSRFIPICLERGWELLLLVHDEIVIQVPEGDCEDAKKVLESCMVEVASEMHDGIKGAAEIFSGNSWGCKS